MYIMLSFLDINGVKIEASNEDVVSLGLSVADGSAKYDEILNWIVEHRIN